MRVAHSFSPIEKSIFLAGPTPRSADVPSWRPTAVEILAWLQFDGTVYVPEHPDWKAQGTYDKQINWEWAAINAATVVVFWIPRDIETMPAFTTNVEFGMLANSGKVVLGFPHDAPKNRYLAALAAQNNIPVFYTLEQTLAKAKLLADIRIGYATGAGLDL